MCNQPVNIVKNGEFNMGLSYWSIDSPEPAYIYVDAAPEGTGWMYPNVCWTGTVTDPGLVFQLVNTTVGTKYKIEFYASNIGSDPRASFGLTVGDALVNEIRMYASPPRTGATFPATYFSLEYKATSNITKVGFIVVHPTNYFCVGGVKMTRVCAPCECEFLRDACDCLRAWKCDIDISDHVNKFVREFVGNNKILCK